jgi:hypothetical protein
MYHSFNEFRLTYVLQSLIKFMLFDIIHFLKKQTRTNEQTLRPEYASELYRPSDHRLSAKLVLTFADRGCHVVSIV